MAGGGSIAGMIISIRNNARLLRKKSMFKKESSFLNAKKELFKASEGKIDIRKATPKELKKVREQVVKNREASRKNFIIAILIALPIFYLIGKFAFDDFQRGAIFEAAIKESELAKKKDTYLYYITDGDRYIEKGHWKNAIFQYQAAVHLFPKEYDAKYRLALAYSYSCLNNHSNCEKGSELTTQLLVHDPSDKKFQQLSILFKEASKSK